MTRRIARLLLIALPLVLAAIVAWVLASEAGLRFALARVGAALDAKFVVGATRGTLAGRFELDDLEFEIGDIRVEAARVLLELRPGPVLVGRLHLLQLEVDGLDVVVTPDPNAPPFQLPDRIELPLHVALERFRFGDVTIQVGDGAPHAVPGLSGSASVDARGLRLDDLALEHAHGRLTGRAAIGLAQPYPVEGAAELRFARQAAPTLTTSIELGGRLQALRIESATAAPLALRTDLLFAGIFTDPRLTGRVDCGPFRPAELGPELADLGPITIGCGLTVDATALGANVAGELRIEHPGWRPATLGLELVATPRRLELERGALRFDGAALTASLSGQVELDRAALPFRLALEARELQLPTRAPGAVFASRATLTAEGDLDAARAALALQGRDGGTAAADIELAPRTRRFSLEASTARWAHAGAVIERARLRARGDAAAADLDGEAGGSFRGHAGQVRVAGRVTPERLTLATVHAALLGGRLDGRAELVFAAGSERAPRWRTTLAARGLDPRGLDPRFPGRLDADLAIDGSPAGTTFTVDRLGGTLRDRAVRGAMKLRHAPRTARRGAIGPWFAPELALDELDLVSGSAKLDAAFDARRARFGLTAPDLADLVPAGRGRLGANGVMELGGGTLTADGAELGLGAARLARLKVDATVPASGALAALVELGGLAVGDLSVDEAALSASGPREDLALSLTGRTGDARLSAAARGALRDERFVGVLEQLRFAPPPTAAADAPWSLSQPAAVRIAHDGVTIEKVCVSDGRARGCLGGDWHPVDPWQVTARLEQLPVGAFGGLFVRRLDYHGTFGLDLTATGRGPELGDSRAELTLSNGRILQPPQRERRKGKVAAEAQAITLLDFEGGRIELERKGERNALGARFALVGGGRFEADLVALGSGPFERRALSGRVRADLDQFALLPALLPELRSLAGRVVADVAVAGTVGEPRYSGRVALEDGSAELPQYGLELSAIGAELTGDGEALSFTGRARSGGLLQWRADLRQTAGKWRANGRVWGERVQVLDVPEARVTATPALVLELDDRDLKVVGEVVVPNARLAPRSLATAVQATSDEVIVDSSGEGAAQDRLRIEARIRLKLGDDVRFEGFGLTSKIGGEITITERPEALAVASGELELDEGKYEAYGQNLTIERGRLLFSGGPVANPGIDVRATRRIERPDDDEPVIVGIDVRGTLREPETRIFATPVMSSSDALAYLVIGRPLADSTESEQDDVSDAATQMKLSGGEFLAQQIGRRMGLDEVRVTDGDDPEQAQLWLGTYLSPRLFVSYGMGLFEQFQTAKVRYTISSKWSVEAESGRENSADFKYTIER